MTTTVTITTHTRPVRVTPLNPKGPIHVGQQQQRIEAHSSRHPYLTEMHGLLIEEIQPSHSDYAPPAPQPDPNSELVTAKPA
ncbi:MAG: hypothetical protein RQ833_07460 [Sphingomonadaceae bacterium]|nr:hypothetical protein [Sphingomonadaceae bacterium]